MTKKINARTAAVKILLRLTKQQGSLASELTIAKDLDDQEKRFAQELCYGTCRWYFLLEKILNSFISKPLKEKDNDIKLLLLLGIYQLKFTRVAPHAAINETVNAALFFRKQWAKKLINGVLRSFQRGQAGNSDVCEENITVEHYKISHPRWLQKAISRAWPEQAEDIFYANNQHPPFTLRVNEQHSTREEYRSALGELTVENSPYSPVGLTLEKATAVTQLPGFAEGHISVQDEAAQLSASLLQLEAGVRVLDACCAPGGKTCHIGEMQPNIQQLVAVDLEERRLVRVRENLARLSIKAEVVCGDASDPQSWWDGQPFERILLDAPCSATGVIRRHPDIKLLRSQQAVNELAELQLRLLNALWPLLADGGMLLYATCSLLPQENTQVVEQFLYTHNDAQHDVITANWGLIQPYGRQLLPQQNGHDGFYYARLKKINNKE
ncbi:MAG: 16S rRNA (cytosine967-C5)-methyltransferase [Candidatus Endobugula sp.]|jgi:16S rRNA (cytosine967-C5)-methyltransferase